MRLPVCSQSSYEHRCLNCNNSVDYVGPDAEDPGWCIPLASFGTDLVVQPDPQAPPTFTQMGEGEGGGYSQMLA